MITSNTKYDGRIHFLDFAKGIIILGIVAYHTLIDLYSLFGVRVEGFLFHPFINFVRDFGAGLMILICGICCHLSRNNLKRGIECLIIALGFSFVTFFFMRDEFIYFGILHFLALAMLGYCACRKLIDKIPGWVAIITFVIFLFVFELPTGHMGFVYQDWINVPNVTKTVSNWNYILSCLGLPCEPPIASADYFPIIPWILLFLTGAILGKYFKAGKIPKFLYLNPCKPISWLGARTMFIYILHQPVVYGLLTLIFYIINKK